MIRYFSVDEEFSGLNHRKNCLLSIGIIEVKEKNGVFQPDYTRKLYIELKPTGDIDNNAMKINGLNIDNLQIYGVNKENAIREIKKYLDLKPNDTAVFVAYCGVLDKIFFDQIFQDCLQQSPFHYEIIEIGSLAMGKLDLEWGFSEIELLEKLGLDELNEKQKHNALNDAVLQAKEFCAIMNYKKK